MHTLVEQHREEIADLCRRYGVRRFEIFGSAARGSDFDAVTSDVDFLVAFKASNERSALDQFFGLSDALALLLGRAVDLLEASAIRNPFVLASVNSGREPVYAA